MVPIVATLSPSASRQPLKLARLAPSVPHDPSGVLPEPPDDFA